MPQNRDAAGARRGDKVLRYRDCAVIDYTLSSLAKTEGVTYQTVRGVFLEGGPAFLGSESWGKKGNRNLSPRIGGSACRFSSRFS